MGSEPRRAPQIMPASNYPSPEAAACRICGNLSGNRVVRVKEMMLGTREEFPYLVCASCGSVQIVEVPTELGRYYPTNRYFSLNASPANRGGTAHDLIEALVFRATARPSLNHQGPWYRLLRAYDLTEPGIEAVGRSNVRPDARILEVGCGNGRLLQILSRLGFQHLEGIDPFLPGDAQEGGVRLRKRAIEEVDPSSYYDLIVLYHALEHVPDPLATLRSVGEHLTPDGMAIVAMPIVNEAFRRYGVFWYQLDPPRHLHVFSLRGFDISLQRAGLRLTGHYFNSTSAQFRVSEAYGRNVALSEMPSPFVSFGRARLPEIVTRREVADRSRAHAFNAAGQGDQAVFYLRRAPGAS